MKGEIRGEKLEVFVIRKLVGQILIYQNGSLVGPTPAKEIVKGIEE